MEAVDWENSLGGSSDTEEYLQDKKYEDDEELHFTSGFISKLQFRKDKSRAHWINKMGMAEVVENKGRLWRTMGVVRSGKIYYSIEETLVDLPSIADIEVLERQCGAIPLRFCHVEYGLVSFFSFTEGSFLSYPGSLEW